MTEPSYNPWDKPMFKIRERIADRICSVSLGIGRILDWFDDAEDTIRPYLSAEECCRRWLLSEKQNDG